MQTGLDSSWFNEEDPETVELSVAIEGAGTITHDIPVPFLEQEFGSDESRREFIAGCFDSMVTDISIKWRDQWE